VGDQEVKRSNAYDEYLRRLEQTTAVFEIQNALWLDMMDDIRLQMELHLMAKRMKTYRARRDR